MPVSEGVLTQGLLRPHHWETHVHGRDSGENEAGLSDRLDAGRPVLHEEAAADKDDLGGGILEDALGGVVCEDFALRASSCQRDIKLGETRWLGRHTVPWSY